MTAKLAAPPCAPEEVAGEIAQGSSLVSAFAQAWQQGETPDAAAWLARYPQLAQRKAYVLDLALEELCRRTESGEELDEVAFAEKFGEFRSDVRRLFSVQGFFGGSQVAIPGRVNWPAPGTMLGKFHLLDVLGRGGFARVYLAVEPGAGNRQLAIKVSPQPSAEPGILGTLDHPGIVPLCSVDRDDATGLNLVAMPFRGRATLADLVGRLATLSPFPRCDDVIDRVARFETAVDEPASRPTRRGSYVARAVHILTQVAEALAQAHQQQICHGDIKPSNVLLTFDGRPMLLDFNLATHGPIELWRAGGTLPYMAPETLRRIAEANWSEPACADPRSDIYSFGAMAFELLSGRLPHPTPQQGVRREHPSDLTAARAAAEQLALRSGLAPKLRSLNPDVDGALQHLIDSCLAEKPDERPTAGELAEALKTWSNSSRRLARGLVRRRRLLTTVGAVALFAIAAATTWQLQREPFVDRQLQLGFAALTAGDLNGALYYVERAAADSPDDWRPLAAKGDVLLHQEEFDAAREQYRAARRANAPETIDARIGYCFGRQNKHSPAVQFYQQAGHDELWVANNLGFTWAQLGQWDKAREIFDRLAQADPKVPAVLVNRANLALHRGNPVDAIFDEAYRDVCRALESGAAHPDLHALAWRLLARKSNPSAEDQAQMEQHLRQAIVLGYDPSRTSSWPRFAEIPAAEKIVAETPRGPAPPAWQFTLPPPLRTWL